MRFLSRSEKARMRFTSSAFSGTASFSGGRGRRRPQVGYKIRNGEINLMPDRRKLPGPGTYRSPARLSLR